MGIDFPKSTLKQLKKGGRKHLVSPNPEKEILVKLFSFLGHRAKSAFYTSLATRLIRSRKATAPVSCSRLMLAHRANPDPIMVVPSTVVDDRRIADIPAMTIAALKFSEGARKRIEAFGGECLTLDQLALRAPTGEGCIMIRGVNANKKTKSYFGRGAGIPGSTTRERGT